ncbi:MAG: NUDIX domain-containing protein [Salinibacterium sp.]|nr:NUDIX domain-containing protein [Salinibacterium sp.]
MMVERRPVQRHDRMVCFDDGGDRFQMRAAGIALRDGRVLVQNIKGDPTTFLPGGRIDQNESSTTTVMREIDEEFGRVVEVGPLVFVVESFFPEKAQLFHEIGFYYGITVPDDFPYHESDICHRFLEGPVEMEYRWVPATPSALADWSFYPLPLRSRLAVLPASTVHILDAR